MAVSIDESQVYCTNASLQKVGRALAIMLEDAMLPGDEKKKHMTVLFRRGGKWTAPEIERVEHEKAAWLVQKYDSAQAPVTFTVAKSGAASVLIRGDLCDLCVHLRRAFAALSKDAQREPHCALFKERKREKKEKKENKHAKLKLRAQMILERIQKVKARKEAEVHILDEEEKQLQHLCVHADTLECDALKQALKSIAAEFKAKTKSARKGHGHGHGHGRGQKHGSGFGGGKFHRKQHQQMDKEERRKWKEQKRAEKKLHREQRRVEKDAKHHKLSAARIDVLPTSKQEIGGAASLIVYVDGYNIVGCDAVCRRAMRGKGGGSMRGARQRMAALIEREFVRRQSPLLPYGVAVQLWFDGTGADYKCGDLQVLFSSKQAIVDDKLVAMFAQNGKAQNANRLVVTSDRELTLRLSDVGVKVMKSGVFYKLFLEGNGNGDDADDEKQGMMEVDSGNDNDNGTANEDAFVMAMAQKLAQVTINGNDGEDTHDEDGDDDDDEDEDGTDSEEYQNEGANPTDELMENDDNAPDDHEYTTIWGEDFEFGMI